MNINLTQPFLFYFTFLLIPFFSYAQVTGIKVQITDSLGKAIDNANVVQLSNAVSFKSDAHGRLFIPAQTLAAGDEFKVSKVGYMPKIFVAGSSSEQLIILTMISSMIESVEVTTGYQTFSKRSSTGSFEVLDREVLNRRVSPDIISRLENMTNAVLFDKRTEGQETFTVRGQSTIQSNSQPLVILDNFPFEGDLGSINPNDIESMTVLKDASASAIW